MFSTSPRSIITFEHIIHALENDDIKYPIDFSDELGMPTPDERIRLVRALGKSKAIHLITFISPPIETVTTVMQALPFTGIKTLNLCHVSDDAAKVIIARLTEVPQFQVTLMLNFLTDPVMEVIYQGVKHAPNIKPCPGRVHPGWRNKFDKLVQNAPDQLLRLNSKKRKAETLPLIENIQKPNLTDIGITISYPPVPDQTNSRYEVNNTADMTRLAQALKITYTEDANPPPVALYIAPLPILNGGMGVFVTHDVIADGAELKLGHYVGERTNKKFSDSEYIFKITDGQIDAKWKRNWSAFMNHSQYPNVNGTEVMDKNGLAQIHFFLKKGTRLRAGEQLFLNYGEDYFKALKSMKSFAPLYLAVTDNQLADSTVHYNNRHQYHPTVVTFNNEIATEITDSPNAYFVIPNHFKKVALNETLSRDDINNENCDLLAYQVCKDAERYVLSDTSLQEHITSLMLACYLGHENNITLLLNQNPNINRVTLHTGKNALFYLFAGNAPTQTKINIADKLIAAGIDFYARDHLGNRAIYLCIEKNNTDLVKKYFKLKNVAKDFLADITSKKTSNTLESSLTNDLIDMVEILFNSASQTKGLAAEFKKIIYSATDAITNSSLKMLQLIVKLFLININSDVQSDIDANKALINIIITKRQTAISCAQKLSLYRLAKNILIASLTKALKINDTITTKHFLNNTFLASSADNNDSHEMHFTSWMLIAKNLTDESILAEIIYEFLNLNKSIREIFSYFNKSITQNSSQFFGFNTLMIAASYNNTAFLREVYRQFGQHNPTLFSESIDKANKLPQTNLAATLSAACVTKDVANGLTLFNTRIKRNQTPPIETEVKAQIMTPRQIN